MDRPMKAKCASLSREAKRSCRIIRFLYRIGEFFSSSVVAAVIRVAVWGLEALPALRASGGCCCAVETKRTHGLGVALHATLRRCAASADMAADKWTAIVTIATLILRRQLLLSPAQCFD